MIHKELDAQPADKILSLMNQQDQTVPMVVRELIPQISVVVEWMVNALRAGHNVYYFGAGTSGRLGVLDAMECPPTFGVAPERVSGHVAGGLNSFIEPDESLEDMDTLGISEVQCTGVAPGDIVIGVSASGNTPYVVGALQEARRAGARTVGVVCAKDSRVESIVDIAIVADVGPEIVRGSTRLKAGTAQKLILNMLSTASFIRLGYVYDGWMVAVQPTNKKLWARALGMMEAITHLDSETCEAALTQCGGDVRCAIVMLKGSLSYQAAKTTLESVQGNLRPALATFME